MSLNICQQIFGISTTNTYVFIAFFILLIFIILMLQIIFKYKSINFAYLPFIAVIFAIILVLPFESKVNFIAWGNTQNGITNNSLWYSQIMQFSIVLGNFYMVILVFTLIFGLTINIFKNIAEISSKGNWKQFTRDIIIFFIVSVSILLLINLYRVFPIYSYDMNNSPTSAFFYNSNLYGTNKFSHEGYWPFFISNFLISYFFTGNFDSAQNINNNYDSMHLIESNGIPIQVVIVILIFTFALIAGIIYGFKTKNKSRIDLLMKKNLKNTNKSLSIINNFLPIAAFSFFTESLLQSQIGTWLHLTFVFILMGISWILFYLISSIFVLKTYKINFHSYIKIFVKYINKSFYEIKLNDDFWFYTELVNHGIAKKDSIKYFHDFKNENESIFRLSETVIFPIILIGYLSFMPTNGWMYTSACNNFVYWMMMFLGSFFCFIGSNGLFNVPNVAQNMQASCAFNVMCGTNTGIFSPFAVLMSKIRIQINLNIIFIPYLLSSKLKK